MLTKEILLFVVDAAGKCFERDIIETVIDNCL